METIEKAKQLTNPMETSQVKNKRDLANFSARKEDAPRRTGTALAGGWGVVFVGFWGGFLFFVFCGERNVRNGADALCKV